SRGWRDRTAGWTRPAVARERCPNQGPTTMGSQKGCAMNYGKASPTCGTCLGLLEGRHTNYASGSFCASMLCTYTEITRGFCGLVGGQEEKPCIVSPAEG